MFQEEIGASVWLQAPTGAERLARALIDDIRDKADLGHLADAAFFRVFVSTLFAQYFLSGGHFRIAHDMLVASVGIGGSQSEAGGQFELGPQDIAEFFASPRPAIRGYADSVMISWICAVYYYVRKYSALQEMASRFQPTALSVLCRDPSNLPAEAEIERTKAVCCLGNWADIFDHPSAGGMATLIWSIFESPIRSTRSKAMAGVTLSTKMGARTGIPTIEWARRTLSQYSEALEPRERVQLLASIIASRLERSQKYEELLVAIDEMRAGEYLAGHDPLLEAVNQSRLCDMLTPAIVALANDGDVHSILTLLAVWFGLPRTQVRQDSCLIHIPSHEKGSLFATPGNVCLFEDDRGSLHARVIGLTNDCLGLNVTTQGPNGPILKAKPEGTLPIVAPLKDWENAIQEFHATAQLKAKASIQTSTAMLHFPFLPLPTQAILQKEIGLCWPLITSFELPLQDRTLRRALVWGCGTRWAKHEVPLVSGALTNYGVDTMSRCEANCTHDEFLGAFANPEIDLLWIAGHGNYNFDRPDLSELQVGSTSPKWICAKELLKRKKNAQRRLVVFNFCFGGKALISNAPAKVGIGPMLASNDQAIITHLWPVDDEVAMDYGLDLVARLCAGASYFEAFCSSLDSLRECKPVDIRNWGSPVFYE
ncbi:MAG: hypothetical protein K1Y02_06130 [Candidatus Hydrogenedentes bacterium]|nr:hypothetical protein [Candidatus Hydrogenedentota bacterium]